MSADRLRLAATISNPWGTSVLPIGDVDIAAVADLIAKNKASFIAMKLRYGAAMTAPAFVEHLAAEQARFEAMRSEYERIRVDFERSGIRTILFKSTGLYPAFAFLSSNLDVLIESGKGELARQRLHELGYTELLNVEEPDKYLFRRFPSNGVLDTFHLHDAVGWGVPFVDVADIWAHAHPAADDPAILIPGPREALLITMAHWFYEDKTLSLQNLFYVADALRKLATPIAEAGEAARARGWEDGFFAGLRVFDRSWELLFGEPGLSVENRAIVAARVARVGGDMRAALRSVTYGGQYPAAVPFLRNKVIYYQKILRDPQRDVVRRAHDVVRTLLWAVRWKLHLRPQKPMLITLSGCDGSGKTIQAEKLAAVLDTCDIRNRTLWSRGGSSRPMGAAIRGGKLLFGAKGSQGRGDHKADEAAKMADRQANLRTPMRRRLFAFCLGLELAVVYGIQVRWQLACGNVVICDRYVYDAASDLAVMAGIDARDAQKLLGGLFAVCPKPAIAFLLDVDEVDALRRKPEEGGRDHLVAARRAFHELAGANGMQTAAAGASIDDVFQIVHRQVLARFYQRYKTVLNGLLASNPDQLNPGKWRA